MRHQMKNSSPKDASMTSKVLIVLTVLVVDLSPCLGQFEGMGMLALAGGMGTGGMGMNGRAFSIGLGLAATEITPAQYAMLDRAVKEVVGPHARPDPALIAFARQQGGPPGNMFQMMGYLPYLTNIARTVGIQPRTGSGQTRTGTNQAQNINDIVVQRATQWMQNNAAMVSPVAFAF